MTLIFDPVTPGWMYGPSLREVGQGVLESLIGNEKVTDRPIDLPTERHVQSNIHSLLRKGGIKITFTVIVKIPNPVAT